jgi:plasmid stabilization system protein ParE
MRILYLPTSRRDAAWLFHYSERIFPQGATRAFERILVAESLLLDNPYAGRPLQRLRARRLTVPRTPFFILYRVAEDRIEILRVPDSRSFDSSLFD